jgi:SAM-dependent methyltransferase
VSAHDHGAAPVNDEEFWNERYRSSSRVWSGRPNPHLVAEVAGLAPGRALEVGCGEGADAVWLAGRGWDVVAADISSVAITRAAEHARRADPAAAGRIEWRRVDLVQRPPEPGAFDLVSAQFMQLPPEPRARLFAGLGAAVRPGGALLVVGHHPSDLTTGVRRPRVPDVLYTPDEVAALLDDDFSIALSEARPRPAATPEGEEVTVHDSVLLALRSR